MLRMRHDLLGHGADSYTPVRLASHLALLLVALGLLMLSRVELPRWNVAPRAFLPAPPAQPTPVAVAAVAAQGANAAVSSAGPLTRMAMPFTTIPQRLRIDIETYMVQPGDSVFGIAERFHVKPETIMWSNPVLESNPDLLRVGDKLAVLPVNGVYHEVKKGETIAAIAKKYKVEPAAISGYALNKLASDTQALTAGMRLVVPGGEKPFVPRMVAVYNGPIPKGAQRGTGAFGWPAGGSITQKFWNGHRAIDIASWIGNRVVAADSGFIVHAGWDTTGYGNLVIVNHGNRYMTYYGHLSKIFVRVGDSVGRGQQIGAVGSTGRSTGPHLHFEVRLNGAQQNPLRFLR